ITIGLTPNHMDAMSHWGVARDVCAWLSHHEQREYRSKQPVATFPTVDVSGKAGQSPVSVTIADTRACARFSGLTIRGITVRESPRWMQDRLKAIGIRSINNIVDITNYVLHEMGQPLHAYDLDDIKGRQIIVKHLAEGTPFVTLDEKERRLSAEDLMICNAEAPMGMAGVFGGLHSGIKPTTSEIFLESAWFDPTEIRKTSFRHGLRTDAAIHFEKGMDISGTVTALKRAASLILEMAGGAPASEIVDVYPSPREKTQVMLKYAYLKKLSGKTYSPDAVRRLLEALGFEVLAGEQDAIRVAVPWHKPDIHLAADLVEEVMRIDGLDNIAIPATITISPSVETDASRASYRSSVGHFLVGRGFHEILTNSITNSAYFSEAELATTVRMINNLSAELDVLRPSLLETGLESIAFNLNRKTSALRFFEFGKTYRSDAVGQYAETNHLCLYLTGPLSEDSWKGKGVRMDFFYLKGLCERLFETVGLPFTGWSAQRNPKLATGLAVQGKDALVLEAGIVRPELLKRFDIRQEVLYADIRWDVLMELALTREIVFRGLPRQLPVHRDLAMVVDKSLSFGKVEQAVRDIRLDKLQEVRLFDIFENEEKLGRGKKSLAVSFTFLDEEKTLTDKEIDGMVNRIMSALEKEVHAEIRK
ncbi:MAG TPA: phenylalanine--tRNA ligase subunit beta, partial [Puia sp.]|nr:phenylalanine--tRNA ligase subunit beta [Puia sp.]